MPAKTIEEAQKYFTEVLGLTSNDYTALHLDVANMINKEVKAVYDVFGNVNEGGYLKGFQIKTQWSGNAVASYHPVSKEVRLKSGDVRYSTALTDMGAQAQRNVDVGFWSTNSPEHAVRHELGHAVGHWLTDADVGKRNKLSALRNHLLKDCGIDVWDLNGNTNAQKLAAGRLISYYALRDEKELVAEAIAEYMAGNPREAAKKTIDILIGG